MRSLVALVVGSCAVTAGAAHGSFTVALNSPIPPTQSGNYMVQDGNFSDSVNSGGNNFYGLGLAQGFTTTQSYSLDHLTVWGASEYAGVARPWEQTTLSTNIAGFQAVLMRQNQLGAYITLKSWTVTRANVTQTLTGNYLNPTLSPVFELGMDLSDGYTIGAGTYYLAVGAILSNPDGDSWAWLNGQWDGTQPNHLLLATTSDTPTSWGQWSSVPNGISAAMHLQSTIPAPGAIALLTAGALASGRRRRR